ncbi:MAG: DinB family protein [Chloroflexi bacterium]|nr:DinB family protein [Chloroflexota bacterium]MCI0576461.1 DinB family protein [Chloroflexota bacterium]MCI0649563.1 DinB family protein [Chloroflexota bacterium]MCI0729361.1 DinB family protein [Chloroflexota bacterium]
MQDVELLAEWVEELARDVRREIEGFSAGELAWQPDPQANSIGVTVWHFSRWLDVLAVRILQNRPPEEELWHTQGWAARTGYDPRGKGFLGLGAVTGYTWPEVEEIPALPAGDLLAYLEQVVGAVSGELRAMSSEQLYQSAPGLEGSRTAYGWVKPIVKGFIGHMGEIQALKAMQKRRSQ